MGGGWRVCQTILLMLWFLCCFPKMLGNKPNVTNHICTFLRLNSLSDIVNSTIPMFAESLVQTVRLGTCFIGCKWSCWFIFILFFFNLKHEGYFDRTHILISRLENLVSLHAMLCIIKALFVIYLPFSSWSMLIFGKSILIHWSFICKEMFLNNQISEEADFLPRQQNLV